MDYQLLQLAAIYAEDARVPRTTVPLHPSRSASSSFGKWIRRVLRRRRGYQHLQQPEDLAYLWLEDGPEDEPERTIFESPEDPLPPRDVPCGTSPLLVSLGQPEDSLFLGCWRTQPCSRVISWTSPSRPDLRTPLLQSGLEPACGYLTD
jgi:hypothetical protein